MLSINGNSGNAGDSGFRRLNGKRPYIFGLIIGRGNVIIHIVLIDDVTNVESLNMPPRGLMVTFPYEGKILELDVKSQTNKYLGSR